jgi:hypothetical protein
MSHRPLLVAACCMLIGCAGLDPHADDPAVQRRLQADAVGDCARLFAAIDRRTDAEGTRDAQSPRVPGFPHLRVDRVLARLAAAAPVPSGDPLAAQWYRALAQRDADDRAIELANSTPTTASDDELAACRETLGLADQAELAKVRAAAVVPDDYSTTLRVLGLYPLTRYLFAAGIERWQKETLVIFAAQAAETTTGARRLRYVADGQPEGLPLVRDLSALGLPSVAGSELAELVVRHAPRLEIETAGDDDRPGALVWQPDDADGQRLVVAVAEPVLYVRSGYAQMADRWLLQLSYTAWFPGRPPDRAPDLLAGRFDGLLWRVTLAEDGSPLIYDTIHPCGCYHLFVPGERVRARARPAGIDEGLFVPQALLAPRAEQRIVLRIAAGTHHLQQVLVEAAAAAAGIRLALRDDDELRSLAFPGGGRRSIFAADGLLPGSERLERFVFWPMGVRSAGQMRQWGRHATAFVGRRHFDDPLLLDRYFERLP